MPTQFPIRVSFLIERFLQYEIPAFVREAKQAMYMYNGD